MISRRSSGFRVLVLAAVLALLAACGSDGSGGDASGGDDRTDGIEVIDPVVPEPPVPTMASLYLGLHNGTDTDDALVAVTVDGAGAADLHRSEVTDDGLSRMVDVDRIDLPAGETVHLEPGGLHVMIDDPPELTVGDTISVTLTFDHAPDQQVDARIVDAGADDHHDHGDHDD